MEKLDVDCIILAAGLSQRMGSWKLGLEFKGRTIIETTVHESLKICKRAVVVTGFKAEQVRQKLQNLHHVKLVHNHEYKRGQFNSLKKGIKNIRTGSYFITLGDLPLISATIYRQLYLHSKNRVTFPRCNGRLGHPVLIPSQLNDFILQQPDGCKMKKLLLQTEPDYLDLNDSSIFCDIDTPADYQILASRC